MKGKHKGMDWTIILAAVLGAMIVYALEGCTPIKEDLTKSDVPLVKFSQHLILKDFKPNPN